MLRISGAAGRMAAAAAAIAACGFVADAANAAGNSPDVVVPVPGPTPVPAPSAPSTVDGCYRVSPALYGPYRMTFCITGTRGTYHVTGGGLSCRGPMWVSVRGWAINIRLTSSFCGRGMQWTADEMVCSAPGPAGRPPGNQPNVVVPVPTPGYGVSTLACTYRPAVSSYPDIQVSATRIR